MNESLNHCHPLVSCLINENWEEGRMANILVIRETTTGFVFSAFLVDLAGFGLKDAWGNYGFSRADMEKLKSRMEAEGTSLIPCDLSLVNTIVFGGIKWAKKWRFKLPKEYKIWLRLLEPVDQNVISLDLFGEDEKPLLVLNEDDLDNFSNEFFDTHVLKADLEVETDGLPQETLNRIGDVKVALISFSRRPEFKEDFKAALEKQFGKLKRPDSQDEWVAFQDRFVLEHKLKDGDTVLERFVEHYKDIMSDDVRELLLGWKHVIESIFEVKGRSNNSLHLWNLVNEREYKVFPTVSMSGFEVKPGDFMSARIVPAKGFHTFSGGVLTIPSDGTKEHRAKIYKSAIDFQMKNPHQAFKDNEEKLRKSRESVRRQYEDFLSYFGSDEIFGAGKEILSKYQSFFDYLAFEINDPQSGRPAASAYEKNTGRSYNSLKVHLPEPLLETHDVGMLCDPVEGFSFLIQYLEFIEVFQNPEQHLGREETMELVMGYLKSKSVSDVPFRRMAERYPENFNQVISYYRKQEGFSSIQIDDLMMEFKPDSFDKLPGVVSILNHEMAELARSVKEES